MKETQKIGVAVSAFAAVVAIGCGGGAGGSGFPSDYKVSVNRLSKLTIGMLEYGQDWDDVLPTGPGWMDATMPYVRDASLYRSPRVQATGYGYAFNSALAGRSMNAFPDSETIPLLFDSTDLSASAVAATSTMPNPPRYGSRNTISYLDGHLQDGTLIDSDGGTTIRDIGLSRIKQLAVGNLLYTTDNDDNFPPAGTWMDGIAPYMSGQTAFHSPVFGTDTTKYGIAQNVDVAGAHTPSLEAPASTIMLFDSTLLGRNATGSTSTLPNPPRYTEGNLKAYADGHAN